MSMDAQAHALLTSIEHEHNETVPFVSHPCPCVKQHTPAPVLSEKHHIFPKEYQVRIWGAVLDERTQLLCPTAHFAVHAAIAAILSGKTIPRSVNTFQRGVARLGIQRITEAQNGGAKP